MPSSTASFAARSCVVRAFTLVELLAVIAIIGVLAALSFVGIQQVRVSAADSACVSNLRQLSTAYLLFQADNKGQALPYVVNPDPKVSEWASHSEGHNFSGFFILRYYYKSGPRYIWNSTSAIYEPIERCPSVRFNGLTVSEAASGLNTDYGVREGTSINTFKIFNSPSRTPLIWDAFTGTWGPSLSGERQKRMPLRHKNGINCGFLDGHVARVVQDDSDGRLYMDWWNQATRSADPDNTKLRSGAKLGVTVVPSS